MDWFVSGALLTGLLASWSYLKSGFSQIVGLFFITAVFDEDAGPPVMRYFTDRGRRLWGSSFRYSGSWWFIPKRERKEIVVEKRSGSVPTCYWLDGAPFFITMSESGVGQFFVVRLTVVGIRGLVDFDSLVMAAVKPKPVTTVVKRRFFVRDVYGTADRVELNIPGMPNAPSNASVVDGSPDFAEYQYRTYMAHTLTDFQAIGRRGGELEDYALSGDATAFFADVTDWLDDELWHRDRHVPWRCGALITGPPGTGKSSLVLATAKHHELPIVVLHIGTMTDREFQEAWRDMASITPCIALMEDLDATFDQRNTKRGKVSFANLLNVIDGVNSPEGILLAITTNHPETLDAALADKGTVSRPGRIDRRYDLGPLPLQARQQLADRILADLTADERLAIAAGADGQTAAAFQQLCRNVAKLKRKEKKNGVCVMHPAERCTSL